MCVGFGGVECVTTDLGIGVWCGTSGLESGVECIVLSLGVWAGVEREPIG